MCLYFAQFIKLPKPQIAAEDIVVYKVLETSRPTAKQRYLKYYTSHMGVRVPRNRQLPAVKLGMRVDRRDGHEIIFRVDQGYHAYQTLRDALNVWGYRLNNSGKLWSQIDKRTNWTMVVVEMVIPKGASYYVGRNGDIVATTLKTGDLAEIEVR